MIPFHPLADIFPLIEGKEFEDLVEDIRVNGIRDPIILHGGMILDGRNRYRALVELRTTGEIRGGAWGGYAGEPVSDDDLEPDGGLPWFERYSPMLSGDPLNFVVSRNLMRRHLSISQRAMLAADLAKLGWGGDRSKPSIEGLSVEKRAEIAKVSPASVERADVVKERGVPELQDAVRKGDIAVSAAEKIARLPEPQQPAAVERALPSGARAIMSSRQEPDDSLDYFPTPPWGTRAFLEHVLPACGVFKVDDAWEPACGEGHMAEVLRERFRTVRASDVFDYGYGEVFDFLKGDPATFDHVDWIITNPPFDDNALQFVLRALQIVNCGVAMFVRWQWCESVGRYEKLFKPYPPLLVAPFVERINLCKGRWEHDGSTATAYCWIVWMPHRVPKGPTRLFWIPPGCRESLQRKDDVARFTAHPVIKDSTRESQPEAQRADTALAAAPVPNEKFRSPLADDPMLDIPEFLRRQPEKEKVEG